MVKCPKQYVKIVSHERILPVTDIFLKEFAICIPVASMDDERSEPINICISLIRQHDLLYHPT